MLSALPPESLNQLKTGRPDLRGLQAAVIEGITACLDDLLIIRAIILRNLRTKHIDNPFGFFIEFLRPVAICAAHYFYFALLNRPVPGHQYLIFTVGGFTIWFTFAAAYQGAVDGATWPVGMTMIPGISKMHLRVAKALWAYVLYVFFAFAIIPPLLLFGQDVSLPNLPITLVTYGIATGLGLGYGLICDSISLSLPGLMPFIKILEWAVFITSGVYDSLVTMPYLMAQIVQYNPLIDLAEYQRYAYYPAYPVYLVTLTYPLAWMLVLVFCGLMLNRALCNRNHR